jgi:hypothetical protein
MLLNRWLEQVMIMLRRKSSEVWRQTRDMAAENCIPVGAMLQTVLLLMDAAEHWPQRYTVIFTQAQQFCITAVLR